MPDWCRLFTKSVTGTKVAIWDLLINNIIYE